MTWVTCGRILLQFYTKLFENLKVFCHGLKMCMCFWVYPAIIFYYFSPLFRCFSGPISIRIDTLWVQLSYSFPTIIFKLCIVVLRGLKVCVWSEISSHYFYQLFRLGFSRSITKTCLYNFDPLKPHFYIIKLGFTGVYIIFFLFLLKNIDCGYPLEPPRRGGSNGYPQSVFWAEIWKISEFFFWKLSGFFLR